MFQCTALTLRELQTIQASHNEPIKAAEELLNIVMKQSGNVYGLFLNALIVIDQQHVYDMIMSGSYRGKPSDATCLIFLKGYFNPEKYTT